MGLTFAMCGFLSRFERDWEADCAPRSPTTCTENSEGREFAQRARGTLTNPGAQAGTGAADSRLTPTPAAAPWGTRGSSRRVKMSATTPPVAIKSR